MDEFQAEKVINEYGRAIAGDKSVFKKQSSLSHSKARIRYAFYLYIAAIVNDLGNLPQDVGESLVMTYCMLDAFIPDLEAERLNKIGAMIGSKQLNAENQEDKKKIDEYLSLVKNALCNSNYSDEINEYIKECYQKRKV